MLLFKGKCIDGRYEHKDKFLQEIQGRGFRNDECFAYIEASPNQWLQVDGASLCVFDRRCLNASE